MRSFRDAISCCTACSVVFNLCSTACCVASSFADAFQPKKSPPTATNPRTTIAGRVHPGAWVRVSTNLSSDIFLYFSSPRVGHLSICEDPMGTPGRKCIPCTKVQVIPEEMQPYEKKHSPPAAMTVHGVLVLANFTRR